MPAESSSMLMSLENSAALCVRGRKYLQGLIDKGVREDFQILGKTLRTELPSRFSAPRIVSRLILVNGVLTSISHIHETK